MLQIDQLNIKIPGISETQGAIIGQQVAEKVALGIPKSTVNQHIPEINLKLDGFLSTDSNFISDNIARQIIRQIKLSIY